MAERKPPSGGKPAAKKGTSRPAGKPGAGSTSKSAASKAAARTSLSKAAAASSAGKPAAKKPGKSIVNQKQTPWGLIATVTAVVLFAAAVVVVVIVTGNSDDKGGAGCANSDNARYCLPELAAAAEIPGVVYKKIPNHTHIVEGTVNYSTTPPTGGNHSPYWADCDGAVYPQPIANENAVHDLEHGSVWVTYREGLPQSDVDTLAEDVKGQTKVLMSPYPDLKSKVSLQAWGYQLFVDSVTDPRIVQFIATLAGNEAITPENASCAQPTFLAHPSTFGHPLFAPAAG